MRKVLSFTVTVVLVVAVMSTRAEDDASGQPEIDRERIAKLARQLVAEQAAAREAAVRALTAKGPSVVSVLREELEKTGDPKLKQQIRYMVNRLSYLLAAIETNRGKIRLRLFSTKTPLTVANFVNLVRRRYYDGLSFHRVISDFMIQGGCPNGDGTGGPGYKFKDEIVADLKHSQPGILSMANSGRSTNGSQFFITHKQTSWLDGKHTVFGKILTQDDMDVINKIRRGDKIIRVTIEGDAIALLAKNKKTLDGWNRVIDRKFPKLPKARYEDREGASGQ